MDISYNSLKKHTGILSWWRLIKLRVTGHETFFEFNQPIQPEFSISLGKGIKLSNDSIICICKFSYIEDEKPVKVEEIFTNDWFFSGHKGYKTLHVDKDPVENKFTVVIDSERFNKRIIDKINKHKDIENFEFMFYYNVRNEYKYWAFITSSIVILGMALFSFYETIFIAYSFASIIPIMALFLTFKKDGFSIPLSNYVLPVLVLSLIVLFVFSLDNSNLVLNWISDFIF